MKKKNEFNCLLGHNIISNGLLKLSYINSRIKFDAFLRRNGSYILFILQKEAFRSDRVKAKIKENILNPLASMVYF